MENIFGSTSPTEMLWYSKLKYVQSTRSSFLPSIKSCRIIFTPCHIKFQCTMDFGGPDYTISRGNRSHLKGYSPYKKADFSAQIVGSNPIVHCEPKCI